MKRKYDAVAFGVVVLLTVFGVRTTAANPIVVNTVADHDDGECARLTIGDCTLREAIRLANENFGPATIEFDQRLESGLVFQIGSVTGIPLPPLLDDGTFLDGSTHPDGSVSLDGSMLSGDMSAFVVHGSSCGVVGFSIQGFPGAGAVFDGSVGSFLAESHLSSNEVGIWIRGSSENFVGPRNTIVSNRGAGVRVTAGANGENAYGNAIIGNRIGTDGVAPLPNHGPGIQLGEVFVSTTAGAVRYNLVGGSQANLISANDGAGVVVGYGSSSNEITSNLIGVTADLEHPLPNLGDGVRIIESGDNAITFNTIAGNAGHGVSAIGNDASSNVLLDNCIGVASVPTSIPAECKGSFVGNAGDGVFLGSGVAGSQLDGNTIASNEGNGVNLDSNAGIDNSVFFTNRIVKNRMLGIDLGSDGLTPNDRGDHDEGPNRLQNSPVIVNTALDDTLLVVSYMVPSATTTSRYPIAVEFFAEAANDQSVTLGSDSYPVVSAGRVRSVAFPIPSGFDQFLSGLQLSSTATDAGGLGSTSEFSDSFTLSNELPVELVDFRATADHDAILIEWGTLTETGNAGFEVLLSAERSVEEYGIPVWESIGFVDGSGTTTSYRAYSYRTQPLGAGLYRIRLRQVDLDGSATFSETVEIYHGVPGDFALGELYPNPASRSAEFTLSLREGQDVQIMLYDAAGRAVRAVYSGYVESNRTDVYTVDVSDLPAGMYLCRVRGAAFAETRSLIVVQ